MVEAVATLGDDEASASVFLVNCSLGESKIAVNLRHLSPPASASAVVSDPDVKASNSMAAPERVVPRALQVEVRGGTVALTVPPVSWAMLQLEFHQRRDPRRAWSLASARTPKAAPRSTAAAGNSAHAPTSPRSTSADRDPLEATRAARCSISCSMSSTTCSDLLQPGTQRSMRPV